MNKLKLGKILDVRRGMSLPGQYYSDEGDKVRLTLGNFNYPSSGFKKNIAKNNVYFTGKVKPEFVLKKGDIITPLTEQVAGLLGETARIPEDDIYIQSGDIGLIIPDEKVLNKSFAYYLISSPVVKKQLGAGAQQTKIRHTSPDKIKDCEAYLPDLDQQKHIGYFLDSINSKIELNNKINAELEAMAKTIYDYWFVQFDFPDENGKPYKSSGGKMVWSEDLKKEIPEGWLVKRIKDVSLIIMGQSPKGESYNQIGEGIPLLNGPADYENGSLHAKTFTTQATRLCKKNDLVFCVRATIGNLTIAEKEFCLGRGVAAVRPFSEYLSEMIYYSLLQEIERFKLQATGSIIVGITKDDLTDAYFLQPLDMIANRFHLVVSPIFNSLRQNKKQNLELVGLRDWLLPMLMNGQVKVIS